MSSVCARVLAAALMAGAIAGALAFPAFVGDNAGGPRHVLSAPPATRGQTLHLASLPAAPQSLHSLRAGRSGRAGHRPSAGNAAAASLASARIGAGASRNPDLN